MLRPDHYYLILKDRNDGEWRLCVAVLSTVMVVLVVLIFVAVNSVQVENAREGKSWSTLDRIRRDFRP